MPEDLPIITANITIANVKDVPYSRNDGTQSQFKSLGHKNADGTWLNLSCFDELIFPLLAKGNTLTVGYTEKWATMPNGQPKMYQGQQVVYRTIVSAELTAGQTTSSQNGSPTAPKAPYNPELGSYQTSLNCATTLYAACIEAKIIKTVPDLKLITNAAKYFHRFLVTGEDALDALVDKAKTPEGLAAVEDEVDPEYEAARDAQESLDDDVPF